MFQAAYLILATNNQGGSEDNRKSNLVLAECTK